MDTDTYNFINRSIEEVLDLYYGETKCDDNNQLCNNNQSCCEIFMVPGNWFEISHIKKNKLHPYNLFDFKQEIKNQIMSNSEKLGFIDSVYGGINRRKISNIEFHIDNDKFSKLINLMNVQKYHPIISFHGSVYTSIKAILEKGYLIPQLSGSRVANGSIYGVGVYSSPFFNKAVTYARINPNDNLIYMIVNIVFTGKIKMISNDLSLVDHSCPINGEYKNGINTKIVFGLDQIISADPQNVIPIALLTIE